MRVIRFVAGDQLQPDAGETVPGTDYLGVITDTPLIPERRLAMETKPKWVIWSVTMLGAAVVAITNVLPSLNGLLGLVWPGHTIEPSWVADFGTYAKATIEGIGGLIGLGTVIYGRFIAKRPLTLLPPGVTGAGAGKALVCLLAIGLGGMALFGCGDKGGANTLDKNAMAPIVALAVKEACNVSPNVIDIATSLGGQALGPAGVIAAPLANTFAKSYAKQLCDQWTAKHTTSALVGDQCLAVMNGVCIHKGD